MRRRLAILGVPFAVLAACGIYGSTGDTVAAADSGSPDDTGASDASEFDGLDAPSTSDALPEATADASGVFFDDFEARADCNPWSPYMGTSAIVSSGANGTAHACRFCFSTSTGFGQRPIDAPAGDYVLDGFVRSDSPGLWSAVFDVVDGDGGMVFPQNAGPLSTAWGPLQVGNVTIPTPQTITLHIMGGPTDGGVACIDIDELRLH
jgi:hypothetical protein